MGLAWFHKWCEKRCTKQENSGAWSPLWQERHRASFSPLTQRILAVNVMALVILAASILYLGQYQDRLVEAELSGLSMQAGMSASAVAEGAVVLDRDESSILSPLLARLMVRRLVESSEARTRVFDSDDVLIADSLLLSNPTAKSKAIELSSPDSIPWFDMMVVPFFDVIDSIRGRTKYPPYPRSSEAESVHANIVAGAKDGKVMTRVWSLPDGQVLLSVASPVQRYKQILGVVMLTRADSKIKAAIKEVRLEIIKIFGMTLMVTLLLSTYLAWTIAQPLKTLARAAEQVRKGQTKKTSSGSEASMLGQDSIPDFGHRQDEIGDLSVALRDMTAALAKRIDAIESFAADVAHEIKNPLTSLRSAVETAVRLTDPIRQKKLMEVILDDVGRLDRLITDISKASRLDAELTRDEATAVDINNMLETLVDFYGQGIFDKRQVAKVILDPDASTGLFVSGVKSRLVQVVQNLIMNALSFANPDTSVVIRARLAENHSVEISVEDNGQGIPEAKLKAIFDRFYSERPQAEKFGTHSGLGLSISKQIIEAHRGRIWAENMIDDKGAIVGAKLIVQLPSLIEA